MELRSFDGVIVCGQRGTGKTSLQRHLLGLYRKVLIFDPGDEFCEFPDLRKLPKGSAASVVRYVPQTDRPEELDSIAGVIWKRMNVLLLVSEAELYLPVNRPLLPNISKIILRGRHRNIGTLIDTRRVNLLNKTVFSMAEWVFVFRHFSPNDIKYLNEFLPEDAKALRDLPDYYFWVCHRNRVVVHDPVPYIVIL